MSTETKRPLMQDLLKQAAAQGAAASESSRKAPPAEGGKKDDKKSEKDAMGADCKVASESIPTELAEKLAEAIEFVLPQVADALKVAEASGPLPTSKAQDGASPPGPGAQGKAHNQPETPSLQSARPADPQTQLKNDSANHPGPGGKQESALSGGKTAGIADRLRAKQAEDAINPAQISSGPAKGPETNKAGESGGAPAGGAPQGPSHLMASAESVANATRGQAYANRKQDLKAYFKEPALTSSTDSTLQQAFAHAGEAGPKVAEDLTTKAAASRVLIERLRSNQTPVPGKE